MANRDEILAAVADLKWFLNPANQRYTGLGEKTPEVEAYELALQLMHDALCWAASLNDLDPASGQQTWVLFQRNLDAIRTCREGNMRLSNLSTGFAEPDSLEVI